MRPRFGRARERAMRRSRRGFTVLAITVVALIGLAGCKSPESIVDPETVANAGTPWGGGDPVPLASELIDVTGGVLTVSNPGGPLDGMTVAVPAGAMSKPTAFDIAYTPITGAIAPNVDPLTPLITVDNGGTFAADVMTLTIPVTIPAGHFAMGFFVAADGTLEGMPLVAETPTSITVATAHFCSFIIAMIAESLLTGMIDSGFRPGTDDWQFANYGSCVSPRGHCAGQSFTAMWYYVERRRQGTSALWNRFDNNGDAPPSPDFWKDDSLGYRLASVVQEDVDTDNWLFKTIDTLGTGSDPLNWRAFLYAMLVTREPQFVGIINNSEGRGHAMIVYKADADAGTLYVADPNYPGNASRTIRFTSDSFVPYSSGENKTEIDAGHAKTYEEIRYYAKTALVDWSQIGVRWTEFDAGTIGNGIFPAYRITVGDDAETTVPLVDGMEFASDRIMMWHGDGDTSITSGYALRRDGTWEEVDAQGRILLHDGDNRLGFWFRTQVGGKWTYGDFVWMTVRKAERANPGFVGLGVQAHAWVIVNHANDPDPETGEMGYTYQEEDFFRSVGCVAYANRSFTGSTFTAHWNDYFIDECGPYSGSMTVTFSESMDEILAFSASGYQIRDTPHGEETHSWSVGGTNIPRTRIGNGFYEYVIDGPECCNHIDTFADGTVYSNGDGSVVSHYRCDVYARIHIEWYENAPEWYR